MKRRRILLEMELQRDLFAPGGSCYRKDSSTVAQNIYDLVRWAMDDAIPVISTLLRVPFGRRGPLSDVPHCVDGTPGEHQLVRTLLPGRINLGLRNSTDLPPRLLSKYNQIIFEKRNTDIFAHARIERLITEQIGQGVFVVCGAGVAQGIFQAAIGLRSRGFYVICPIDGILRLGHPREEEALDRMAAKGVVFVPTARILATGPAHRIVPIRARLPIRSTA
ncbi:MAG: isochorismatase family protein [Planctomycetota bacterium]|nr:isochorismatase family protein [Planctomycetota bacterium]